MALIIRNMGDATGYGPDGYPLTGSAATWTAPPPGPPPPPGAAGGLAAIPTGQKVLVAVSGGFLIWALWRVFK
jgi:hypothetical protein